MKLTAKTLAAGTALAAALTGNALAADLAPPVVIETPTISAPEAIPAKVGGWYIRGDVSYNLNKFRGADYMTATGFDGYLSGDLDNSYSLGGGIGYHFNHNLRADVTLDYDFKSDFSGTSAGICTIDDGDPLTDDSTPCNSSDTSGYTAWTLLANAYVDLGTFNGFTPYVGGGIGGARVSWHPLVNEISGGFDQDGTYTHEGFNEWRFAYALMAGVSYDVSHNVAVDVGYRYRKIHGQKMFDYEAVSATGVGVDRGLESHQFRAGLRYKFGGGKKHDPFVPPYNPPVYK
ncbi:MAG: outer membrane protein [Pseudomonadota bacterium]